MIKIAVCDDEKQTTAELEHILTDILGGMNLDHEIACFLSGNELCHTLETGVRYDLIFLDIEFSKNEINGVEAGRLIREAHHDNTASIVYISWAKRYAMQLFQIRPLDFLIKPLSREKIEKTIKTYIKIAALSAGGKGEITYKKGHATHNVRIRDIIYLEARDRKVIIHRSDGTEDDFYGALKDVYEEQLKENDFLFIHASYAVNYDYVTVVKYNAFHVVGSLAPLPVSRNRKDEVREQYSAIMKRRMGV